MTAEALDSPEASSHSRRTARARDAMVCTSHPLAARAGADLLKSGGNAVDAAVAAAAVLCVVDPRSVGIGGDAFATIWEPGDSEPRSLMAAGPSPAGLTLDSLREAGFVEMPSTGPWTITVPGAVAGWKVAIEKCGELSLEKVLTPAIQLALGGFHVTPRVAEEWRSNEEKLRANQAAAELFLPNGKAPRAGDRFSNKALARSLEQIAREGTRALYEGRLAESIATAIEELGGPLRSSDLAEWTGPTWEKPLSLRAWSAVDVFLPPPPGQGVALLEALGIYGRLTPQSRIEEEHLAIESLKLSLADAARYVCDPECEAVEHERLLSEAFLAGRRAEIRLDARSKTIGAAPGDTVYVAVIDKDGRACSWIQSLYEGFGSGIAVPGTGIVLQNRGANFVMDEKHPNRAAPRKRPYNTIIPSLLGNNGDCIGCLGIVGGFMQPQGQFQILRDLIVRGHDPYRALTNPRFRVLETMKVGLEVGFDRSAAAGLEALGHQLVPLPRFDAGGAQLILRDGDVLLGASDPRKDGIALGL